MKAFFYLFLFFLFLTPLASAQTVSVGDYSTVVDSHITVPINISDAESIAGGVVNISFDPSIVSIKEVTAGDFGNPMPNINNIDGWVKIVAARIDAVNKNQAVLANIVFNGSSNGTSALTIEYASLNNETGALTTPLTSNGKIVVSLSLDDTSPPSSIRDLVSNSGSSWINWTWTNPSDLDFNHTMVYLDGKFVDNTSDQYFTATNLVQSTIHTISTHTVDINGNINETWVNDTSKTTGVLSGGLHVTLNKPVNYSIYSVGEQVGFDVNITDSDNNPISSGISAYVELSGPNNISKHIILSEEGSHFVGGYTVDKNDPRGLWLGNITVYNSTSSGLTSFKVYFTGAYFIKPYSNSRSYLLGESANFTAKVMKPGNPAQFLSDENVSLNLSIYPYNSSTPVLESIEMVYDNNSHLFSTDVSTDLIGSGLFTILFIGNDTSGNIEVASLLIGVSEDYAIEVSTEKTDYDRDNPVNILGTVKYLNNSPLSNINVNLLLDLHGFKRSYVVNTSEIGEFNYTFHPFDTEAGNYTIRATAANMGLLRTSENNFTIHGLYIVPQSAIVELVENSSRTISFTLYNLGDTTLTSISTSVNDLNISDNVIATIDPLSVPSELQPYESASFNLQIEANTPVPDEAVFQIEVTTDQMSNEISDLDVKLFSPTPILKIYPEDVLVGLNKNQTAIRTVGIYNMGYGILRNVTLHQPENTWMRITSNTSIGDLLPGENATFEIHINSYNVDLGVYFDSVNVTSDNFNDVQVNLTAFVTDLQNGRLLFHVTDALERNLSNANISLINQDTYEEFDGATNSTGYALMNNLPVGRYIFIVSSDGTNTLPQIGNVEVEAMDTPKLMEISLYMSFIDFDWEVMPTSIEDYYNVILRMRFETDVPIPLLLAFPPSIDYNMIPGEEKFGSFKVYNVGLVSIYNVSISSINYNGIILDPLVTNVNEIKGKSSIEVPYKISLSSNAASCQRLSGKIDIQGRYLHFINNREVISYARTSIPVTVKTPVDGSCIPDSPDWPDIRFCVNIDGLHIGDYTEDLEVDPNIIWLRTGPGWKDQNEGKSPVLENVAIAKNNNTLGNIQLSNAMGITLSLGVNELVSYFTVGTLTPQIPLGVDVVDVIAQQYGINIPFFDGIWKGTFDPKLISPQQSANLNMEKLDTDVGLTLPKILGGGIIFNFGDEECYNCVWVIPIAGYDLTLPTFGLPDIEIYIPHVYLGGGGSIGGGSIGSGDFSWNSVPDVFIAPSHPHFRGTTYVPWNWPDWNWPDFSIDQVHRKPRPRVTETIHEVIELSISQNVTMERDAFWAGLGIFNKMPDKNIDNVMVTLHIKDDTGSANDKFFIKAPQLKGISNIDGSGIISPSGLATSRWLIIPKPGAGGIDPEGAKYNISANITYSVDGINFETVTHEVEIFVKPQPEIVLDYFIPSDVIANKPFKLAVKVTNDGYGEARDFAIETAQPVIYYNPSGLLLDFEIIRSQLQGEERSTSMKVDFGDIQPGESKIAWWDMVTSIDGTFTEFTGEFTHSSELGGMETSLIKEINTYIIQKQMGSGELGYDFLANSESDENYYILFNSSTGSSTFVNNANYAVVNMPTPENPVLDVSIEDYTGDWVIVSIEDPYKNEVPINKVIRTIDGTEIPSYNYWMRNGRILIVDHYDAGFDGNYQIIYSGNHGVSDLEQLFIDAYNRNGGLNVLGSPTTGIYKAWGYWVQDYPGANGYFGGRIIYNPYKNYAYYIHGPIWERYYNLGGPKAVTDESFELGPPTNDIEPYVHTQDPEVSSHETEFRYQKFEGGSLEHNLTSGIVYEVHGAIYDKWKQLGAASSGLGMPTTDEKEVSVLTSIFTGRYSEFEGGIIHWIRELNQVWVIGLNQPDAKKIMDKYYSEGGSGGWLGFPVSNDYINPSGYLQCDFEGGYITTTDGVNYEAFEYADKEPPTLLIKTPEYGDDAESYRIEVSGSASDESGMYCIMVNRNPITYYNTDIWNTDAEFLTSSVKYWKTNVELQTGENKIIVTAIDKYYNSVTKAITVYYNPDFSFAHITDVHIGYDQKMILTENNPTDWENANKAQRKSNERFTKTLEGIANQNHPKFMLITGDLVEWNGESFFKDFKQTLDEHIKHEKESGHEVSAYCIPGNHDRRTLSFGDDKLEMYNKYIKDSDGTLMHNYHFYEGEFMFIGLDSGSDWSVEYKELMLGSSTPEGSGLEDFQYNRLLESDMKDHPNKIIFMHHPVINEGDDDGLNVVPNLCFKKGGNDMCIGAYRCALIDYSINHGVQLILTGHTHSDKAYDGRSVKQIDINSDQRPLFIQTPSATKDSDEFEYGYRIIDLKGSKANPHPYTRTEEHANVNALLECPANLHVYDSQERHTGVNISGEPEYNIPNSFFFGGYTAVINETLNYTVPESIFLYNTTEEYRFEIVANLTEEEKNSPETESFNFTVEQEREDMRTTIIYLNVPLTENTTATLPINLTTTAYTMEIDHDGDGTTDETRDPNFTETNYAPTAAIISPETGSIYNAGEPIEFNGTGRDPEDGILTNFSIVWYSDMNGVIGAGERFSTANLTPGMHMITLMINDSVDLVDTKSVMITVVDRTPPSTITNPHSTADTTWLNWTWTNPPDPDFNHTELYLNGTFLTNIPAPQNYYNITGLLPDTSYELSTHTVDTSGNINETWVNDTAHTLPIPDNTPPTITFISSTDPSGTILTTRNWTFINVSLSEPGFSWLEWNGINESMSGSGTHWYINKTGLDNGVYAYHVWANDSAGNVNVSETRMIEIDYVTDALQPVITITSPVSGTTYNTDSIDLNYSVNEPVVWRGYSLDGSANITLDGNTTLIGINDGLHTLTVYANDTSKNMNSSTVLFTVDTTPSEGISDLQHTAGEIWINWTWTNPPDPDYNHTELYLNGTFLTNIPAPQNYYNITGLLSDTSYELSTRTVDINGNINETWVNATAHTFSVSDDTPPIITFILPTDPSGITLTTRNWTFINVSLSEPGLSWLEWNGINESMSGSVTYWCINKTGLDNGVYTYCVWANDSAGNVNVSETRAIEIDYVTDTLSPVITITSPVNDTTYNTDSVDLNYSINEPTTWQGYSTDGAANITLLGNTTLTDLIDGLHTLTVYANDTSGNINSSTVWFTIDTTPPTGIDDLMHTVGQTWINWTWLNPPDQDFNHTELYFNGTFITNILGPHDYFNATGLLPDTSYELSTRTVDTSGNINETWVNATARTLSVSDDKPPDITFISPTDPTGTILTTRNWTFINVSLSEPGLSWLEWNGINESMAGSGTNWYINKTDLVNDLYTYQVWANDSAGNENVSEIRNIEIYYVTDNLPPIITINSPINDTLYTADLVELNYSVNEPTIWEGYSLDGADNISLFGNITLFGLNDGLHILTVYANDTAGNMNLSTVWFTIDTTPPSNISDLLHTAGITWLNWTWTNPSDPDFNHTELYLNGTFLTHIPATQNYYNATGLLPDTSYELGTHTVDTFGNINETWVNDTARTLSVPDDTPPAINFILPTDPSGTALTTRNWTFINVSLAKPGHSWLEWNGINESMAGSGTNWYINKTNLVNGVYTYRVWANDTAGNENSSETRTIEIDYVTDNLPIISITSPMNDILYTTDSVELNYTVNEPTIWEGYSLDGADNITLFGNTTLFGLNDASHILTIYANDTSGNMNSSTVQFAVDTSLSYISVNITFVIIDSETKQPIEDATVSLHNKKIKTNETGIAVFSNVTNVKFDKFKYSVKMKGYKQSSGKINVNEDITLNIELMPKKSQFKSSLLFIFLKHQFNTANLIALI